MFQAVIMVTNNPSDIFTEMDLKYIDSLDERKKRQYLATRATSLGKHGVSLVSKAIGTDRKTIYRGIHELKSSESIPDDSIRREGGGRRRTIDMHPEYMDVFHEMVDNEIAGLPQDEDVRWLKSSPSQISDRFYEEYHIHVSVFIVKQLIAHDGYRYRKPLKSLPMRECKDRDKNSTISPN